ncbi:hypothetical protein TeGR_g1156 [Tetraparma gracilis]|uniref:GTP-binding protein n=1 Tax=Tetraparma gracilis TaxID=2962635 RepID=A0ABQ6MEX5_9STRA|nr:hypothetical protein TeGR_g1156 [Tetraparma gracilis]
MSPLPSSLPLPRVLIMGPRRAGKSSISSVVLHKMSPHETLFRLDSTASPVTSTINNNALCPFAVVDFPGDWDLPSDNSPDDSLFGSGLAALIFVLDAQDEPFDHSLARFASLVARAVAVNPGIHVEVFINKVDGELFLSDEAKYDCRRDVMSQVQDELADVSASAPPSADGGAPADLSELNIGYYLTSIYDHSIFASFSKVVQKLIPTLPTIESLLNVLVASCRMEKAFLFDVVSKLYISTDSTPVDAASVELCSDMIDVVLDVSGIYGKKDPRRKPRGDGSEAGHEGMAPRTDSAVSLNSEGDLAGGGDSSYYDSQSSSSIHLSNGMVLYLKEVDSMLALVCLTREDNILKKGLVDYNISVFKDALGKVVAVNAGRGGEDKGEGGGGGEEGEA